MEAAFFDLDKTIISRSSSLALSRPMYRAGMVRAASSCAARTRSSSSRWSARTSRRWTGSRRGCWSSRGAGTAQVERLVQDVLIEVIDPFVYQEALDLMALHRCEGRGIYIVSSSPEEVVRPLARHFGVAA